MISIFATGFLDRKPELELVGAKRAHKCLFDVIWERRKFKDGEWVSVWERATFEAWDDLADKVASTLDRGFTVNCTGTQETSEWHAGDGSRRKAVRYQLATWSVVRRPPSAEQR